MSTTADAIPSSAAAWQGDLTLAAAVGAAAASILAAAFGAFAAYRSRVWTGREHVWARFVWACEKSVSNTFVENVIGLITLTSMVGLSWVRADDSRMVVTVRDLVVAPRVYAAADSVWKGKD